MQDLHVPQVERSDIKMGASFGSDAEGSVHTATMQCRGMQVAVKVVPLPQKLDSHDMADLRHVVTTTFLASRSSHVCQMLGASCGPSDLWCDLLRPSRHAL